MHVNLTMIITAAMLVVAVIAAGKALFATRRENVVQRRLRDLASDEPIANQAFLDLLTQGLAPIASAATPTDEEKLSHLRLQLTRAGLRAESALQVFLASKLVCAAAALVGLLWFVSTRTEPIASPLLLAVASIAIGYYAPNVFVAMRVSNRQRQIERSTPDALDLIVTCVEAGLGLDAALQRVARETRLASPVLGDELEMLFLEIKAGIPRADAFRRLADRTGVPDLKALAATLTQTEMFGTSLGLALRVQSEGIRSRRMYKAEERAGYVAVKMTLPLVFFILPTLFVLVAGPAVLNIAKALLPAGGAR